MIFDVDGTLAPEGELVSIDTVRRIIRLAKTYDLKVGICTGRAYPLVSYLESTFSRSGFELDFTSYEYGVSQSFIGGNGTYHTNHLFEDYARIQEVVQALDPKWMLGFHYGDNVYKISGEGGLDFIRSKFPTQTNLFGFVTKYQFLSDIPWMGMIRMKKDSWDNSELQLLDSFNPKHGLGELYKVSKAQSILALLEQGFHQVLYCGNENSDREVFCIPEIVSWNVGEDGEAIFQVSSPSGLLDSVEEYLKLRYCCL